MALIKIFSNGSFEMAAPAEVNIAVAASAKELKAELAALRKDLGYLQVIGRLRDRIDLLRTTLKHTKPTAKEGIKTRIEAVKVKMAETKAKRKYPRLSVIAITKRIRKVETAMVAANGTKPTARNSLKVIKSPQFRTPGTHGATPAARTPRAPKDHGAAFERSAKRVAGNVSRSIRSELRQHAKVVLSPVANKPGAQAKKIPVAKTSAAAKHPVKQGQAPITATLAVIKGIKAQIATGLTGAKLARARQDLAKNREALAVLRAGKTAKNQASIVKPGTAKHLGGAKKIVGKESGMGDASKKPATSPKEMEKIKGMHANSDAALDRQLVRRKTRLKEMQAEYRKAAAGPAKTRLGVQIANMVKSIVKIS